MHRQSVDACHSTTRNTSGTARPLEDAKARLLEQRAGRELHGFRQSLNDLDRGIANFALDARHISAVKAGLVGQLLLRPAKLFAPAPQISRQTATHIHGQESAPLRSMRLQTMSLILLDCRKQTWLHRGP